MYNLNVIERMFMMSPINKLKFDKIFELKMDQTEPVLCVYKESQEHLKEILWEEFNIPGMDVRTANTAFNFLITRCKQNNDLADTLRSEIKNAILHAAIFYTNVAPDAVTDTDWKPDSGTETQH